MVKYFKVLVLTVLTLSLPANAKEFVEQLNVTSIKKESEQKYHVLFKEKSAIYKSSPKHLKCLTLSIKKNKPILIKWDINKLEIQGCKSKRKPSKI